MHLESSPRGEGPIHVGAMYGPCVVRAILRYSCRYSRDIAEIQGSRRAGGRVAVGLVVVAGQPWPKSGLLMASHHLQLTRVPPGCIVGHKQLNSENIPAYSMPRVGPDRGVVGLVHHPGGLCARGSPGRACLVVLVCPKHDPNILLRIWPPRRSSRIPRPPFSAASKVPPHMAVGSKYGPK